MPSNPISDSAGHHRRVRKVATDAAIERYMQLGAIKRVGEPVL